MNQLQKFEEEELIPISALQHLLFCERQCALIHLERIWEENQFTAEGKQFHENVDTPGNIRNGNIKIVRSLRLRSLEYGLTGISDIVEFHKKEKGSNSIPFPIEYKLGSPKQDYSDTVQLCAQALCLEEMLNTNVPEGAFFYGKNKRRFPVKFDSNIRDFTIQCIHKLHLLFNSKRTPTAVFEKKCLSCSLITTCMPACTDGSKSVSKYIEKMEAWILTEDNL